MTTFERLIAIVGDLVVDDLDQEFILSVTAAETVVRATLAGLCDRNTLSEAVLDAGVNDLGLEPAPIFIAMIDAILNEGEGSPPPREPQPIGVAPDGSILFSGTWNEPGADPVADIIKMREAVWSDAGFAPTTMYISRGTLADLTAAMIYPGRWPWDWLRRRLMRWALRRLYAYQDAQVVDEDDEEFAEVEEPITSADAEWSGREEL